MALPRRATVGGIYDRVELDVYDINTKQIIFTGTYLEIANKLGVLYGSVQYAKRNKTRIKNQYAIRIKKCKNENRI